MGKVYSHPGKELKDHLFNVYKLGMDKFSNKDLGFSNIEEVKLLSEVVLISHDFGKANQFFQKKLKLSSQGKKDSLEYKKLTKAGNNKSSHSLLSALFTYYILDELLEDDLLSLLGLVAVYRHHSNLKNFKDMLQITKWNLLKEQFSTIDLEKLQSIIDLIELEIKINKFDFEQLKEKIDCYHFRKRIRKLKDILNTEENYLIFNWVYSLLISSDKAEAIFYNKNISYDKLEDLVLARRGINPTIVEQYKKLKGWNNPVNKIDKKRNQIYDEIITEVNNIDLKNDRILSINVPTGTGKTLGSLSAALKLRDRLGQNHRLIYTLPFTSIIDQNYNVFEEVLAKTDHTVDSSLMIKHHYLTPKTYTKEDYENEEYDISKHLIESWNSEIIVTTFVQLLHSIFSNQNRSLIKFHNLANSIILLDEVQNIPHKYWGLIKVFFKEMAKKLDCYFVFITATMPLIYNEEAGEIKELAVSKEDYFNFFDRIKLDLSEFREEKTIAEFKEFIGDELIIYDDKSFLIVLNTIKTSTEIYNYIQNLIAEAEVDGEIIYLSTNIIPKEREKRIKKIGEAKKRQIIVSTQMVEAGVDIDLDRVYRDLAPLDSINQTCGRCNRNFNPQKKGVVTLVKLINEDHNNKSYASYVYSDILLASTEKILASYFDFIQEEDFFELNKKYFSQLDKVKSNDLSQQLLEKIQSLKYEQAFWNDESGETFELIAQEFATVNLFIEINEEAKKVWEQYKKISELDINSMDDYSKRKAMFERIKREFLNYVITIPEYVAKEHLEATELENTFNRIDNWQCESVYDIKTGFKRTKTEVDTFF